MVVSPLKSWACVECAGSGDFLTMDDAGPLCLSCADLDHLAYLPAGDAALTRRARKASDLSAVVVRFSRTRRRYERQGVLVEEEALERRSASVWPTRSRERGAECANRRSGRRRMTSYRRRQRGRFCTSTPAAPGIAPKRSRALTGSRHERGCGPRWSW